MDFYFCLPLYNFLPNLVCLRRTRNYLQLFTIIAYHLNAHIMLSWYVICHLSYVITFDIWKVRIISYDIWYSELWVYKLYLLRTKMSFSAFLVMISPKCPVDTAMQVTAILESLALISRRKSEVTSRTVDAPDTGWLLVFTPTPTLLPFTTQLMTGAGWAL